VTVKTGSGIVALFPVRSGSRFGMSACLQLFMNMTLDPGNNIPALASGGPFVGGASDADAAVKDSGSSAWSIGHD
jgi:hypothetical protein